jgi:hypothetical protein
VVHHLTPQLDGGLGVALVAAEALVTSVAEPLSRCRPPQASWRRRRSVIDELDVSRSDLIRVLLSPALSVEKRGGDDHPSEQVGPEQDRD